MYRDVFSCFYRRNRLECNLVRDHTVLTTNGAHTTSDIRFATKKARKAFETVLFVPRLEISRLRLARYPLCFPQRRPSTCRVIYEHMRDHTLTLRHSTYIHVSLHRRPPQKSGQFTCAGMCIICIITPFNLHLNHINLEGKQDAGRRYTVDLDESIKSIKKILPKPCVERTPKRVSALFLRGSL